MFVLFVSNVGTNNFQMLMNENLKCVRQFLRAGANLLNRTESVNIGLI